MLELDYKQCNLKNFVSFDYRKFLLIMGIFFQKELESTAFYPQAFIILTALCGTLTDQNAHKPMAENCQLVQQVDFSACAKVC